MDPQPYLNIVYSYPFVYFYSRFGNRFGVLLFQNQQFSRLTNPDAPPGVYT